MTQALRWHEKGHNIYQNFVGGLNYSSVVCVYPRHEGPIVGSKQMVGFELNACSVTFYEMQKKGTGKKNNTYIL